MSSDPTTFNLVSMVISGVVMMILLTLIVLLYIAFAQKKIFRQQLYLKEMEAKHKEDLLHNNIQVLEEERRRIAKDLHDDIGSLFSALRLKINQIEHPDKEVAKAALYESRDLIDNGVQSVRHISHNMVPPGLEMFGLPDTLEGFCEKLSSDSLDVSFSYNQPYKALPPHVELGLYRITQELSANSIRHSGADKIRIQIYQTPEGCTYTYSDNGKGFDFNQIYNKPKGGMGLRSIEARVSHIGGQLEWDTRPGGGFALKIQISTNTL